MWQRKSRPVTHATRSRKRSSAACLLGSVLLLVSCRRDTPAPAASGIELRVAHLTDLAWMDREQTGQPVDFMPPDRYQALLTDLTAFPSDILLLRGIGSQSALKKLSQDLPAPAGDPWHMTYIEGPTPYAGIGFLTTSPPAEVRSLSDQQYAVEGQRFQPLAGGIRIDGPETEPIWIWNAQLPEPDADYENRRNEARLLSQALRPLVDKGDHLLLSVHCREESDSPMIRMITDAGLVQIHAEDSKGDRWTHRDPDGRVYLLDQLLFASPALATSLPTPPRIHSSPELRTAGAFRHQRVELP